MFVPHAVQHLSHDRINDIFTHECLIELILMLPNCFTYLMCMKKISLISQSKSLDTRLVAFPSAYELYVVYHA